MDQATLNSFLLQQQNAIRTPKSVSDAFSSQQLDMGLPQEQPAEPSVAPAAPVVAQATQQAPAAQAQPEYGFSAHEQRRLAAQEYASKTWNNFARSTQGMVPEERNSHAKTIEKLLESRINKEDLKPFEETRTYQNAADEAKQLREKNKPMLQVGSQLLKIQKLIDSGDPEAASQIAKMGTMKAINSLVSPDAVSIGEAMLRYPQLLNAAQINVLTNSGIFSPKGVLLKSLDSLTKKQIDSITDAVQGVISDSFNTDPSQFIKIAYHIYNSVAEPYNQAVGEIEQRTSERHAFDLGARKVRVLGEEPIAAPQPIQQSSSISYPSGTPVQLGALQSQPSTVSSSQIATPQQAQPSSMPVQQQAVPAKRFGNPFYILNR